MTEQLSLHFTSWLKQYVSYYGTFTIIQKKHKNLPGHSPHRTLNGLLLYIILHMYVDVYAYIHIFIYLCQFIFSLLDASGRQGLYRFCSPGSAWSAYI